APPGGKGRPADGRRELRYQSLKPDSGFPRWAGRAVNEAVQQRRFAGQSVPRELVLTIQQPVPLQAKGLTKRDPATGELTDASDESRIANILLPVVMIVLMYVLILVGASPAMQQ